MLLINVIHQFYYFIVINDLKFTYLIICRRFWIQSVWYTHVILQFVYVLFILRYILYSCIYRWLFKSDNKALNSNINVVIL